MPYLDRDGDVFVLYLGDKGQDGGAESPVASLARVENRFHPDWMTEVHSLLDEVEASSGPAALVTTATGKFYSNGLDTDWLFGNLGEVNGYLDAVHTVYTRLLTFPMTTVAAVNGHAFGAGAMLALSQDFRVMRADRGYYCLPEVHLGMPFSVGMNALLVGRLPNQVATELMTTGVRVGGADAVTRGIVDETAPDADTVLTQAVARAAASVGVRGPAVARIKQRLHAPIIDGLAVLCTNENLQFGAAQPG